ncbi:aminoglycoside 3'-phosphotransferase [Myceligenerans salitolerans]|uniref:Aminoglycoside 3'-phosphotransferase n=1 Tax=Myceligenerans salitolerans TaxID=1230528 RepID=A0ABS3I3F0_9MICO|nr:aminoglycoside 3'-phosphotransferase [Myceligenerans salitolerans]MBO0607534.1 aminoglycoside 3'-phosphotransferase [Myceligenerans salitolerans]
MVVRGVHPAPVEIPDAVHALAGWYVGWGSVTPVWRNDLGGLTFRLEGAPLLPGPDTGSRPARYLKWVPAGAPCPDPFAEAGRLSWARRFAVVPKVIDVGRGDDGAWLLTEELRGTSAIEPRWRGRPRAAAHAIGEGLRLLHDTAPVADCPFTWTPAARTAALPAEARAAVGRPPAVDRLVVCHGDACVPNTLLHDDGTFAAHVDLGELGVADRWSDLAVASRSVARRFQDPQLVTEFFAAYGIAPDPDRIEYYRRLWDVVERHRTRLWR